MTVILRDLLANLNIECQQSRPAPFSSYASAPNDIWSLGVILVNLTCGRNPWKRACFEDSTFRAYSRDRQFLKTILPLTSELNEVLNRIFELDPAKRITIPELRDLILRCERLTTFPAPQVPVDQPRTPPYSPVAYPQDIVYDPCVAAQVPIVPQMLAPVSPVVLPSTELLAQRLSQLSDTSASSGSDAGSVFSDASFASSNSSISSFQQTAFPPKPAAPLVVQSSYASPTPYYVNKVANYFQGFQAHTISRPLNLY